MTGSQYLSHLLAAQGLHSLIACDSPGIRWLLEDWRDNGPFAPEVYEDVLVSWEKALKCSLEGRLTALLLCDFSVAHLAGHLTASASTDIPGGLLLIVVETTKTPRAPNPRLLAAFADVPALVAGKVSTLGGVLSAASGFSRNHRVPVILPISPALLEEETTAPIPAPRPAAEPARLLVSPDLDDRASMHRTAMQSIAASGTTDFVVNAVHGCSAELGVIVDAALYPRLQPLLPTASWLVLGMAHPIPDKLVRYFSGLVKHTVVADESGMQFARRLRGAGFSFPPIESLPSHRPADDEELRASATALATLAGKPPITISAPRQNVGLDRPIRTFDEMMKLVGTLPKRRVAIAGGHNSAALHAGVECLLQGLGTPVFVGDPEAMHALAAREYPDFNLDSCEIHPAFDDAEIVKISVALCREGKAEILLKGGVNTPTLMRAALSGSTGLRAGSVLSDSFVFEYPDEDGIRLVMITDGGVTMQPSFQQKIEILMNSVLVAQALGNPRPRVGLLAASETVSPAAPMTMDCAAIMGMNRDGRLPGCVVEGPIALDVAISRKAAAIKGTDSEVAGQADILVASNIDTANALAKSTTYFAGYRLSHVIVGGTVPILIPSRSDTADAKLLSIALGSLMAKYMEEQKG